MHEDDRGQGDGRADPERGEVGSPRLDRRRVGGATGATSQVVGGRRPIAGGVGASAIRQGLAEERLSNAPTAEGPGDRAKSFSAQPV